MFTMTISFCILLAFAQVMAHDSLRVNEKEHIKEHLQGTLDLDKLTEDEMRFHYFRVHDAEGDNKLDGCELVQSMLHFHAEASITNGDAHKVFTDSEFSIMVDPVLENDDKNNDGVIDYAEFIAGQLSRGF